MAFFTCGMVRVLVGVLRAGQPAQRGSVIYFNVADIVSVAVSLKSHGVAFPTEPHAVQRTATSELWLAEFKGPDGNQLALISEVPVAGA